MAVSPEEKELIAHVFTGNCIRKKLCPVKDIMASYGDKWSMYTVLLLGLHQKMRFSQLKTEINGISQRMLTVTLRSLEEDGIVDRTIFPEIPPKVEYRLTSLGEGLLLQLVQFATWADDNLAEILKSREKFEKRRNSVVE